MADADCQVPMVVVKLHNGRVYVGWIPVDLIGAGSMAMYGILEVWSFNAAVDNLKTHGVLKVFCHMENESEKLVAAGDDFFGVTVKY